MESLGHECGVALVRLLKPLGHFQKKYETCNYGLDKLCLMMEKQHNRGQEGAGIACVKMHAPPGEEFIYRERATGNTAIQEIFGRVTRSFRNAPGDENTDADYVEKHSPFAGEIYMGHLRYSTTGRSGLTYIHPFLRRHSWQARNLCICGNFNITNVNEIFNGLTTRGLHPRNNADTYLLLEQIGHFLDRENERLYEEACSEGLQDRQITEYIEKNIDIAGIFRSAAPLWDGGYVICAVVGSGETIVMRDPWGIRSAFWYKDDEKVAIASERPVIQTSFNVKTDEVCELKAGQAIIINKKGETRLEQIAEAQKPADCSFERIYFSRGNDRDIYKERKALGACLRRQILESVDYDLEHTVFSFIPNTAETAFYGMMESFEAYLNENKAEEIKKLGRTPSDEDIGRILNKRIRSEKIAWKDIKMRTFITEGSSRKSLAAHVYDVTYGSLVPEEDSLVIIDDSIVRGTTLRESIIRILDRLRPKKIVIVSSSPQVRYPDYYGIDMANLEEFIAFRAAIRLLEETQRQSVITDTYAACKAQEDKPKDELHNYVKNIYAPFSDNDISEKMAEMLKSDDIHAEIKIVFQTIENLRKACPNSPGDWYFSGDYPTKGGIQCLNRAYIEYIENVYFQSDAKNWGNGGFSKT